MKIQRIQDLPGLEKMKKIWGVLFFLASVIPAIAQTRDDIRIYIPPVMASPEHAAFFNESFAMETQGAGYSVTDRPSAADYTLKLEVKPNMIEYDDGTIEQAPPDEKQYLLQINLIRNEDDVEIVAFSFPFDYTDEMFDYDLYLLYEAMANVPLTKLAGVFEEDDRWRNKWVYIRSSLDYPITFYGLVLHETYNAALWEDQQPGVDSKSYRLDNIISPWLAASFGVELQYLNWMSTEVNFNLSFKDPMSNAFIVALQIEQKFPIKPSRHFMIEPYAVISFPTNTSAKSKEFPSFGAGGGAQFGVKGGSMGAFFVDLNFIYYFGNVVEENTNPTYKYPTQVNYYRFVLGLGIGYKIGFLDRAQKK